MRDIFIEKYMQSFSAAKRNFITGLMIQSSGDKSMSASDAAKKLQTLLENINSRNDEPITVPYTFPDGALIYGPTIQGYFRQVAGDAYTLLNGLNETSRFNETHKALFSRFYLKSIEDSIKKLEERLEVSELINSNKENDFVGAYRIDFNNLGLYNLISNTDLIFDSFTDQKLDATKIIENNAGVAGYLPKVRASKAVISGVKLKYPESSVSAMQLVYDGSDILNLIDQEDDDISTFFAPIILSVEKIQAGAVQKIQFSLDGVFSVNSIIVKPTGKFPCFIDSITYDNQSLEIPLFNEPVSLVDLNILDNRISGPTIVDFDRVKATHINITFLQDTYSYVTVNTGVINGQPTVIRYTNSNSEASASNILPGVTDIFRPASDTNAISTPFFKYEFGFSDISIYDSFYDNMGYYISPEYSFTNCLLLGVDRDFNTKSPLNFGNYSIEHMLSVVVQADQSTAVGFKTPLMPVGSEYMIEKVKMSVSGSGYLSFPIEEKTDIIQVYINGGVLSPSEYDFDVAENTKRRVTVQGNFKTHDIVTFVYEPVFIKYPERKYSFNASGAVFEDIDNSGIIGIDERFLIVFYNSKNNTKVRHRLLMRSYDNDLIRLNSLDLLYSLQDPNKYRGI